VLDAGVHVQPRRGLPTAAHLQLLQDIMHVVLDRGGTDRKLTCDVLIGPTLLYQSQDFALARRVSCHEGATFVVEWQRPLD
jgi:hypothetical protein